jgi:hypothetical protein
MDSTTKAKLLEARAEREAALAEQHEAHENLVLELEDKYAASLGFRGRAFEIANEDNTCGEGPIVVKPADAVAIKLWRSKEGNAPEDALTLARTCVLYPEAAKFADITHRRPHLLDRTVTAILKLSGVREQVVQGKF